MNERTGELIGYAVGNGCMGNWTVHRNGRRVNRFEMVFGHQDEMVGLAMQDRLNELLKQLGGVRTVTLLKYHPPVDVRRGAQPHYSLRTTAGVITDYINEQACLTRGAAQKAFTKTFLESDPTSVRGAIRGLFTADGTCATPHELSLTTVSETLVDQVVTICESYGMFPRVRFRRNLPPRQCAYTINFRAGDWDLFQQWFGFIQGTRKDETLRGKIDARTAYWNKRNGTDTVTFKHVLSGMGDPTSERGVLLPGGGIAVSTPEAVNRHVLVQSTLQLG